MSAIESRPVGEVVDTAIYPFKGMQGVKTDELLLRSISVVGDRTRAYSLVDSSQSKKSTFLDSTKYPGLLRYAPSLVAPEDPKNSDVAILTPEGNTYLADSEDLLQEVSDAAKKKLAIVRMGRGAYHSMPVSLLSMSSVRDIETHVGYEVDPRRFRENILVETNSDRPYEEDNWIGKIVTFGDREDSARIAIVKPDPRCATVNMDPVTGEKRPEVLRAIVRNHENTFGVYATVLFEGKILKGDTVYVTEAFSARK